MRRLKKFVINHIIILASDMEVKTLLIELAKGLGKRKLDQAIVNTPLATISSLLAIDRRSKIEV